VSRYYCEKFGLTFDSSILAPLTDSPNAFFVRAKAILVKHDNELESNLIILLRWLTQTSYAKVLSETVLFTLSGILNAEPTED
jgi:hypothetical protein